MEVFYNLMMNQGWGDILAKAKSDQTNLRKNSAEWTNICSILQSEFIKYATDEKPVLVSKLCFEYLKLKMAGYITLTDENTLAIEELGIKAFEAQESPELNSFIKICQFSPLAQQITESNSSTEETSSSNTQRRIKHPRTDWLNPLFKSSLESHFYQALKDVFPSYFIYPNVALSNIFEKDSIFPHLNSEQRTFYFNGVVDFVDFVDFVVYDRTDGHVPKYFFEVDSFYHDRQEAKIRDAKKNAIFNAANITLHRIRPESDSLTTQHDFFCEINKLIRESSI
jgi:Protein of unknown function (DUF2726)